MVQSSKNKVAIQKCLIFLIIYMTVIASLYSQSKKVVYTRDFAQKLEKAQADFIRPVEGFYKIKVLDRDEFMKYDLVLRSQDKAFEMRFAIHPNDRLATPQIQCFNLLNSIATNDAHFDIKLSLYSEEQARSDYNAEWAAYADFVPKKSYSDYHYGRLVTIYREGSGLIHQVLLFNQHDREKNIRMHSISFLKQPF